MFRNVSTNKSEFSHRLKRNASSEYSNVETQ